jgi:hypothetical protein
MEEEDSKEGKKQGGKEARRQGSKEKGAEVFALVWMKIIAGEAGQSWLVVEALRARTSWHSADM